MDLFEQRESYKKELRKEIEKPKTKENLMKEKKEENIAYRNFKTKLGSNRRILVEKKNKHFLETSIPLSKQNKKNAVTEEIVRTEQELIILNYLASYVSKMKIRMEETIKQIEILSEETKKCLEPDKMNKILLQFVIMKEELDNIQIHYYLLSETLHLDGFDTLKLPNLNEQLEDYKKKNKEEIISILAKDCQTVATDLMGVFTSLEKWASGYEKGNDKKKTLRKRDERFSEDQKMIDREEESINELHHRLLSMIKNNQSQFDTFSKTENTIQLGTFLFLQSMTKKMTSVSLVFALLASGMNSFSLLTSAALLNHAFKNNPEEAIIRQRHNLLNLYEEYEQKMTTDLEAIKFFGDILIHSMESVQRLKQYMKETYAEEIVNLEEFKDVYIRLENMELELYKQKKQQEKEMESLSKNKKEMKRKKLVLEEQ